MKKKSVAILTGLIIICVFAYIFSLKKTVVIAADNVYEEVFTESVLDEFNKQNPRIKLQISYGTSTDMKRKIEQGEKIDLFLSAVEAEMNSLEEKGYIDAGAITSLWRNNMVLVAPKETLTIKAGDITNIARVAICHPDRVQSGADARAALEEAGKWGDIRTHMVYATSETEVLNFVVKNNVDAGIMYASTATAAADKISIIDVIPGGDLKGAVFSVGVVHSSKASKQADVVIDYLKSDAVDQAICDYGFTLVE